MQKSNHAQHRAGLIRGVLLGSLLGLLLVSHAWAFSGSLSSVAGGLNGTGNWIVTGPTSLSWIVTQNGDGSWHYDYTFAHPRGATSHFLLETSASFTLADISNAGGEFGSVSVGTWTPQDGNSNPGMPGNLFGLKFNDTSGNTTRIYFDCTRAPVWGDFYSKNGNAGGNGLNAAWNAGFLADDPLSPASNGSVENHILRPDTFGSVTTPVPEPGSLLLLGTGLAGLALFARRRTRR